jgi:tRNA-specific 2-thiouridylase
MIPTEQIRALMDLPGDPGRTRVVAAMSGGVDSAVAAALARQAGFDVVGITLQLYASDAPARRKGACCAGQDIQDARLAAAQIGIPHYVLDYTQRFRTSVIEDFASSYVRGETPVPCIQCNQTVKFHDLLGAAKDLGASALVTGHYIRPRGSGAASGRRSNAGPELFPVCNDACAAGLRALPAGWFSQERDPDDGVSARARACRQA